MGRWPSIKPPLAQRLVFAGIAALIGGMSYLSSRRRPNAVAMLAHHLRHWPTLKQHWVVYSNQTLQTRNVDLMLIYCWVDVGDVDPAMKQHWLKVLCLQELSLRYTLTKLKCFF